MANEYDALVDANEYDALLAQDPGVDAPRERMRASLIGAQKQNPDEFAKAKQLERRTGIPAPVVVRNLPAVEQAANLSEYDTLLESSPALARQLQSADFANVSYDDAATLRSIERRTSQGMIGGPAFRRDYDRLAPTPQPEVSVRSALEGMWNAAREGGRRTVIGMKLQAGDALSNGSVDDEVYRSELLRQYQGSVSRQAGNRPAFESSTGSGLYSGLESFAQQTPGFALSLATRSAWPALASIGVQTEADAYGKYRARGADPALAFAGAAGEGAVEVGTEMLPMGFLVNKLGKAGAGEFLRGLLARELPTEQVATFVQDAIDTAVANPDKTWGDFWAERPDAVYQTALATISQAGVMQVGNVAAGRLAGREQAAQAAEQDAAAVMQLGELAAASKLAQRDPQTFAEFVDAAAAEGPVKDIYIDARTLQQAAGENIAQLAQLSPSIAAQLDEAVRTGGDVVIPLGEYASTLAVSDANALLQPHLRTAPDAMSVDEAQTFMQSQAEEFQQEADKLMAEKEFDTGWRESVATVENELATQLKETGRFTDDVNSAYAKLMSSFYSVTANRLGMTPEEMYVKYPLQIRAEALVGGLDQPAQQDTPEFKNWFGDSKVVDAEGKPLVVYHGTDKKFTKFSFKNAGQKIIWFTSDKSQIESGDVGAAGKGVIMDMYATIKNPAGWKEYDKFGLDELEARGYDGVILPDPDGSFSGFVFNGKQLKSASRNRGTFDPNDPNILNQGESARGQITFGADIQQGATIALLKNADLSSFLHEMGHLQLEILSDIASQPDAPADIVADMNKLLVWFGVPDLATWRAMSLDEKRPYHEQFARGFESYLFEGKSPNIELSGLFARFRAWLINVYKSLKALNVELTAEVRGVMDRLVATNEEIVAAEAQRAYNPLFETKPEDIDEADWQDYQRLGTDATQTATEELGARTLRDMQWLTNAKSRELKRLQKDASAKRAAVEAEVTAEVRREPAYAAMRFFKEGITPDGETLEAHKLDTDALLAQFPELKGVLRDKLPNMTGPDGVPPDAAAELFGFSSAHEMIEKLLDAQPEPVVIEGMTDTRMLERFGDLTSSQVIDRAVNEAIRNDVRARFAATEYKFASKAPGPVRAIAAAAKDFAAKSLAGKRLRDIRPSQYEAAEARAQRAAEKARGKDDAEFVTETRNKMLNNALAREAYNAAREIEKGARYLKKAADSATIDAEYKDQIAALLDRYDLRKITNKEADRRKSLLVWVESQREKGYEPVIDPAMLNEAQRKPYREMTLEEFRGLVDTVRNIEHLGRLKHKLLTAQDDRDFAARVAEAERSIVENAKTEIPPKLERNTFKDRLKEGVTEYFVMHRKFASMLREMDGWKDGGVMWELLVRPMNKAGDTEAVMREQATEKLAELFKPLLKAGKLREKMFIPEIGTSLSREGRIMVALNTGNEGNLQRLMDGDRWSTGQVRAILDTLSKEEMDFVQQVWDYLDTYRAKIGAQQKRLTGIEPEWVQAAPVETRHGTYRGGYFPAKYDTTRSTRSMADEASAAIMDQWRAAQGRAKTRDSFTKGRAEAVINRPLRKDFGVITQHVTEVTHRLAWQDFLIDATRLLNAGPIDGAIRDHYGPEILKSLRDAVTDIAAGEVAAQNAFESGINYLRSGATIAGMGWRITTSLLQPLGLTQSMVRIGPKWVARGLADWLGDAARMENSAKRIYEKSAMMRLRGKTMQREISEIRNKVAGRTSAIEASYFYLIQKMQLVADIPTWLGQYHKAIEGGADEATAVAQADQAVLDAQSGGQIKDLAAIQRGSPLLRLFTNFYSFFNTTYNLTKESVGRTKFNDPLSVGRLAVDMLLLYSVPAALGTLMKAALAGEDDEDELLRKLAADQLTYLFGTMVGLREFGGGIQAAAGLPGDYQGPAGVRFFTEVAKLSKQAAQGEVDEALLKAANNVGGILFHYPSGQVNATASGVAAVAEGRTENPGALLVGGPRN